MNEVLYIGGLQKAPLYEQVADMLEKHIVTSYGAGMRLPSEQDLAEQFQVSRTIIREALKLLKERGLIDSKTGSGAFTTKPDSQNISDVVSRIIHMEHIDYNCVFDVRGILETEATVRAARNASEAELDEIKSCLDVMRDKSLLPTERSSYDFHFHYLIAKASDNPLLALLTEAIASVSQEIISKTVLVPGNVSDGIVRHDRIFDALCRHDEIEAKAAAAAHIETSRQNYKRYLEHTGE